MDLGINRTQEGGNMLLRNDRSSRFEGVPMEAGIPAIRARMALSKRR